eukprot:4351877-Prymnesium_polylepis.1
MASHNGLWPEVALVERCGPQLASVLSPSADVQELLFPGGSQELVRAVYEDSVISRFYNTCVLAAVDGLVLQLPDGAPQLQVVEIGAGTGGTTNSVLPSLATACARYLFTDVSQSFLREARQKFAVFHFVEYHLLNISLEPGLQGFA